MRYKDLLLKEIEDGAVLRELARKINIPPPSLHNYLYQGTEPRRDALEKMSRFFREPVSQLLSEDDDTTARILTLVRRLDQDEKLKLLTQLDKRK
jgi:transcriptional regulator with XRE-family HTH domain